MGAVIDVLAAKIPQVDARRLGGEGRRKLVRPDGDPMGGVDFFVERLTQQPSTELGLADPSVAQDHELGIPHWLDTCRKIGQMCPHPRQTVVARALRQNLGRHIAESAVQQIQLRENGPFKQGLRKPDDPASPAT